MLQFFFDSKGKLPGYEFTLGWLFWGSLELGTLCGFMTSIPGTPQSSYWFLVMMTVSGLSTVSVAILGMKRLRDAGLPVFMALILLVPFISVIASVVMSNMPSNSDK